MAVQLFKTLLNQIPLLSSLQSGTLPLFGYSGRVRPMKKAHTGESGLKWEAKDSSKLIGTRITGAIIADGRDSANQVDYVESKLSAHRCVTPS